MHKQAPRLTSLQRGITALMNPGDFDKYHMRLVFGMPVVANVNWFTGTKAQRLWGESVTFQIPCTLLSTAANALHRLEKRMKGNKMKKSGGERDALWVLAVFADRKVTGDFGCSPDSLPSVTVFDRWLNTWRVPQTSNKSYAIFPFQPQPCRSFINGLIRFVFLNDLARLHGAHLQN